MKNILKYLFVFTLLFISIKSHAVNIYVTYARFYSPVDGPYLETYLVVAGNTANYLKNSNGKYQAGVEVAWLFYRNDSIVNAKRYLLKSAEVNDSLQKLDFTDVQRFLLTPGKYEIEIVVADNSQSDKQYNSKLKVEIEEPKKEAFFSDIELIENVVPSTTNNIINKGGVELSPYHFNFFPDNYSKIIFYTEIYNSSKMLGDNEKFVVTYGIEDYNTNVKLTDYASYSKQSAHNANSILGELTIENLKSGNYTILIEARDKSNKVFAEQRMFFQRIKTVPQDSLSNKNNYAQAGVSNFELKIHSKDSLIYYIKTLWPISSNSEREFAKRVATSKDEEQMRNYIHTFWDKRNPKNPEFEFHKYNRSVIECNSLFSSTNRPGYKTDRGRVFLMYGPPDQRGRYENEPANYPYEIWQYYTIKTFRNRRFVFYNPSLASNNYVLLHSDAIGERRNDNWKVELHSRSMSGQQDKLNIDNTNSRDYMGNQVDENFNNPR